MLTPHKPYENHLWWSNDLQSGRADSAGIATAPTPNNYGTGSAGMNVRETHSPIPQAGSGK